MAHASHSSRISSHSTHETKKQRQPRPRAGTTPKQANSRIVVLDVFMLAVVIAICAAPSYVIPTRAHGVASSFPALSVGPADDDAPFKAFIDDRRTLHIEGTGAAEIIIAEVIGDPASIAIAYRTADEGTSQKAFFRLDAFDRLVLNARGGADVVNIIDAGELLDTQKKILKLDGGDGDNIVVLSHLPFKPENATQLMRLLNLSRQMEDVAKRAGAATSQALTSDAMKLIDSTRLNIADVSRAMAADGEKQLFDPARELVERSGPRAIALSNSIIAKSDDLAKQHAALIAELTKKYGPVGGVFPPDDDREESNLPEARPEANQLDADVAKEKEVESVRVRGEQLAQTGLKLGDDAKKQVTQLGNQLASDATGIEQRADDFERRAQELSARAEALATQGETDMTAAADRVRAVVAELETMEKSFQEAGLALRDEIQRAVSLTPKRPAPTAKTTATGCNTPIATTQTYNGSGFFLPIAAPWASWSITGGSGNDVLIGGFADDDIHGGSGNDVICGLKGNDHIHGDDGTDLLFGEFFFDFQSLTGDDCVWGDDGTDLVVGDNFIGTLSGTAGGDDNLWGGKGIDIVVGDDVLPDIFSQTLPGGNDTMEGNDNTDIMFGCGGDDPKIDGNDDMDFAEGNGGADVIDGGDGRNFNLCNTTVDIGNLLLGGWGDDKVTGGAGIDVILGDRDDDTLTGKDQVDIEIGGSGRDTMDGNSGGTICIVNGVPIRLGNLIDGGPDKDTLRAGGDLDVMLGRDGNDKIYGYDGSFQKPFALDADVILGGPGDDYLEGDNEQLLLLGSLDFMFGGPGDDDMHGGKDFDLMFGDSGSDTMHGDSNALNLNNSFDLMFGGPDPDWMDGGNSFDLMFGEGGNDMMLGDDESFGLISPDFMVGGPGADVMNGGSSLDLMFGEGGDDNMLGDSNFWWQQLSFDLMWGGPGADYMDGGNYTDFMFGGPGCDTMLGDNSTPFRLSSDFMLGEGGNDEMDGGNSSDLMWGGDDNDTMFGDRQLGQPLSLDLMWGDDGCDTMYGGQGFDLMFGGPGVDQMDGQLGPDLMLGGASSDVMNGGDLFDFIWGNDGNDLIHGNDFPDLIVGGDGDDCLYGDNGQDMVQGNDGNDCIHGGSHSDLLVGNNGDDLIFGDNGNDLLAGGAGDDKLDGGSGIDLILGGSGNDEGWSGLFFGVETKHKGGSGLDCNCKIDVCTGRLCVHKFNDLNGDGIQNSGEPNLQNWAFQLTGTCTGATLITNANGNACGDFFAGTYSVVEQMQAGWTPTTPTTQTISVTVGQTTTVAFGNKQSFGDLCIHKFDDLNGNGVQDTGEPVLANWSFTVTDLSGASTTYVTDSLGSICQVVLAGNYTMVEIPKPGWIATTPATQTVTVTAATTTNANFGNRLPGLGRLCIFKFKDVNGNGVQDTGESILPNWSFTVTDSSGAIITLVTHAPPGCVSAPFPAGIYTVVEVPQAGWTATTPTTQTAIITTNTTTNVFFGNH